MPPVLRHAGWSRTTHLGWFRTHGEVWGVFRWGCSGSGSDVKPTKQRFPPFEALWRGPAETWEGAGEVAGCGALGKGGEGDASAPSPLRGKAGMGVGG